MQNKLGGRAEMGYSCGMTETEQSLLDALLDLEQTVARLPGANPKPDLRPIFGRIDGLTDQLPKSSPPELLHYLHKKSYQKARLFLQDRDPENAHGNCHGHH